MGGELKIDITFLFYAIRTNNIYLVAKERGIIGFLENN